MIERMWDYFCSFMQSGKEMKTFFKESEKIICNKCSFCRPFRNRTSWFKREALFAKFGEPALQATHRKCISCDVVSKVSYGHARMWRLPSLNYKRAFDKQHLKRPGLPLTCLDLEKESTRSRVCPQCVTEGFLLIAVPHPPIFAAFQNPEKKIALFGVQVLSTIGVSKSEFMNSEFLSNFGWSAILLRSFSLLPSASDSATDNGSL